MTRASPHELIGLRLRCSPIERAREWLSTRGAFIHAKHSPRSSDPPAVCVIAQNTAWGGVERHTRALIHGMLRRGLQVKYLTGRDHVEDSEVTGLEDPRFEWLPVPLCVDDPDGRRAWTRTLRSVRSHEAVLACPRVEMGSLGFLGALRRSFRHVVYIEHLMPTPFPAQLDHDAAPRQTQVERLRRSYRMRCADRIVAVSEAVAAGLCDAWFAPPAAGDGRPQRGVGPTGGDRRRAVRGPWCVADRRRHARVRHGRPPQPRQGR